MKKERPILFSTPMVQAILEGRKTQTRRVVKMQSSVNDKKSFIQVAIGVNPCKPDVPVLFSPYGKIGDVLWVRETFHMYNSKDNGIIYSYKADNELIKNSKIWKPSIHMPKAASRISLEIIDVRVERLHDISEDDAKAEGVQKYHETGFYVKYGSNNDWCANAYASFTYLWESINGKESWDANPWVWVIEFKRI